MIKSGAYKFGIFGQKTTPSRVTITGEIQILGSLIGTGLTDTGSANASNLLLSTQGFTSPEWTATGLTAADNITTAPNGTSTAGSITEGSGTSHTISQTIVQGGATTYAFSFHAKQALRTRIVFNIRDTANTNGAYAVFDLAGGLVGVAGTPYGVGFSIAVVNAPTSVANGFYRGIVVVTTPAISQVIFEVQPDANAGTAALNNNYAGNTGAVALYIWGAQVEVASSASAYGHVTNRGLAASSLSDGDLTNFWGTLTQNAWVGVDSGSSSTQWTRYRFTPRPGSASIFTAPSLDYETMAQGAIVQMSSMPDFSSGNTTLDTIPNTPYYARFNLHERAAAGTSQYIRIKPPTTSYGSLSELQLFGVAGTTTTGAPVAPTISPWGGRFPSGTQTVTLASLTTSAQIYYTTDGTTPSNINGTLYAGPFSLSMGGIAKTLKAVAYQSGLSTALSPVSSAIFNPWAFKPKEDWYDNRGVLIEAHSGGIIYVGGTYYWVGTTANKYSPPWSGGGGNLIRSDVGVMMYSSTDLKNWTFVGNILPLPVPASYTVCLRPHVLFNAANNNFVLWVHLANAALTVNLAGVAKTVGSDITSGWSWVNTALDPDLVGFKDNSLFLDPGDGVSAYVVYTKGNQNGIQISKLAANYQSTVSTVALTATGREAPVLVRNGATGNYFLITSTSNFYDSTSTFDEKYITSAAANPLSGWGALPGTTIYATDPLGTNYNSQSSFSLLPNGKTQSFLGADYWVPGTNFYGSRQVWLPITFPTASTLQVTQPASWDLSDLV